MLISVTFLFVNPSSTSTQWNCCHLWDFCQNLRHLVRKFDVVPVQWYVDTNMQLLQSQLANLIVHFSYTWDNILLCDRIIIIFWEMETFHAGDKCLVTMGQSNGTLRWNQKYMYMLTCKHDTSLTELGYSIGTQRFVAVTQASPRTLTHGQGFL